MKSDTIKPPRNGNIGFTIFSMGVRVMEEATYRLHATGGVQKAMHSAKTIIKPKWTGSIPKGVSTSRNRGPRMTITGVVSKTYLQQTISQTQSLG